MYITAVITYMYIFLALVLNLEWLTVFVDLRQVGNFVEEDELSDDDDENAYLPSFSLSGVVIHSGSCSNFDQI